VTVTVLGRKVHSDGLKSKIYIISFVAEDQATCMTNGSRPESMALKKRTTHVSPRCSTLLRLMLVEAREEKDAALWTR
jgi:hypothetical protein